MFVQYILVGGNIYPVRITSECSSQKTIWLSIEVDFNVTETPVWFGIKPEFDLIEDRSIGYYWIDRPLATPCDNYDLFFYGSINRDGEILSKPDAMHRYASQITDLFDNLPLPLSHCIQSYF